MFVKPADGRKVRDPLSKRHIPEAGIEVPESSYWLRRISEGDVLLVNTAPDEDAGHAAKNPPKSQTAGASKRSSSKE